MLFLGQTLKCPGLPTFVMECKNAKGATSTRTGKRNAKATGEFIRVSEKNYQHNVKMVPLETILQPIFNVTNEAQPLWLGRIIAVRSPHPCYLVVSLNRFAPWVRDYGSYISHDETERSCDQNRLQRVHRGSF